MINPTLQIKHDRYRQDCLYRKRTVITSRVQNCIVINKKKLINFSSNDYLGIATDPKIKRALKQGASKYGLGSTASALICGYHRVHKTLEEKFSVFLQRESAILFNSGYLANLAVIGTLATKNTQIISDRLCHASLIDAIGLSKAKHYRYRHNDLNHLKSYGEAGAAHKIIVTESVFSMEGDIADIKNIAGYAEQINATLLVDDAHGVGVLGQSGRGICEAQALSFKQVPILIIPLGKAFASLGAIVSGSKAFIEALVQFARPYIYTTALPPALVHATLTALQIVKADSWRREKLWRLIQYFTQIAQQRNLPIQSNDLTPIKSLVIGCNKMAIKLQQRLQHYGFFVYAIRPPTVPVNTARLRISLNCLHDEKQITDLLDVVAEHFSDNSRSK
jgi:8-amino-7-oxononanoate synthase